MQLNLNSVERLPKQWGETHLLELFSPLIVREWFEPSALIRNVSLDYSSHPFRVGFVIETGPELTFDEHHQHRK